MAPSWSSPSRASRALGIVALVACSSSSGPSTSVAGDAATCYPDTNGFNGGSYTLDLTVDDSGFSKLVLATENDAQVTLTLTNQGTLSHGFEVGCTTAATPEGCPTKVCFPAGATIAPIAPGTSKTVTFTTPTADGLIYPFRSSAPADASVSGLDDGQWSLE
jgi:hypothetical protein